MNRGKELPPLSEAQLEVMQEVWSRGEATVTDVWQAIAERRAVARNTILTVMDRLERRGWLSKRPIANSHLYKATVNQKKTMSKVIRDFVDNTLDGTAAPLIVAMLEEKKLTKEELDSIAALIEAKKRSQ